MDFELNCWLFSISDKSDRKKFSIRIETMESGTLASLRGALFWLEKVKDLKKVKA